MIDIPKLLEDAGYQSLSRMLEQGTMRGHKK